MRRQPGFLRVGRPALRALARSVARQVVSTHDTMARQSPTPMPEQGRRHRQQREQRPKRHASVNMPGTDDVPRWRVEVDTRVQCAIDTHSLRLRWEQQEAGGTRRTSNNDVGGLQPDAPITSPTGDVPECRGRTRRVDDHARGETTPQCDSNAAAAHGDNCTGPTSAA